MKTFTRLSARCCAIMALLPAVSAASGSADTGDHALCRERALAEGLRSEEVILDYIFECVQSQSNVNASGIPVSGISSDAATGTVKAPRRSPATGVDR
jgi:hypothetical protein